MTIDLLILLAAMAGMVALGLRAGRSSRTAREYLVGGGHLPWWAVLASIVATETSTATFLSVPGITYATGGDFRFLQMALGFIVGRLIVAQLLLPRYFTGQLYSAYELLRTRFGTRAQRLASLLFWGARNIGDGLRLFLAGLALEKVLAVDLVASILTIGAATILYTYFGGIKAVVWADCLQFVIYICGGVVALWVLVDQLPEGWRSLTAFGAETGRWKLFDWRLVFEDGGNVFTKPYTIWSGLIGGAVLSLGTHGADQMMIQRCLCAGAVRNASKAMIASGFVVFAQFAFFLLLGVGLACYYSLVDPRSFAHNDAVFATFIVQELPVGVVGLTLAAVFSAAMSTLSSSLNSSATAAANDFFPASPQPSGRDEAPSRREDCTDDSGEKSGEDSGQEVREESEYDRQLLRRTRRWTIVFGLVQIGIGILASRLTESVVSDALAIAGFTAGILLGVFLMAFRTRRANETGVVAGMLAGIGVLLAVRFLTPVAWPWYAVIGAATTSTVGWLVSVASGDKDE